MKYLVSIFCLASLLNFHAEACLWTYRTDLGGHVVRTNSLGARTRLRTSLSRDYWQNQYDMAPKPPTITNLAELNDFVVILMHLGKAQEAMPILEKIERDQPGSYITAANLGTAYELVGNNQQALSWISKGIEINEDSHFGTEWLHLKILRSKIELEKNPQWLSTNSVLDLDFGKKSDPVFPPQLENVAGRSNLIKALEYQLYERLPLVPPPDPVIADLLFDYANLAALGGALEDAIDLNQFSLEYGSLRQGIIALRNAHFTSIQRRNGWKRTLQEIRQMDTQFLIIGGGLVALTFALIIKKLWKRFDKSSQSDRPG